MTDNAPSDIDKQAVEALTKVFEEFDDRIQMLEGMVAALADFAGSRIIAAEAHPAPHAVQDNARAWDGVVIRRQLDGLRRALEGYREGKFGKGYAAITDKLIAAKTVVEQR